MNSQTDAAPPLAAPPCSRFVWRGDIEDDCTLRVGDLLAHVECMGEIRWKDPDERRYSESNYWFVSVSRVDESGRTDGLDLFHSGEHAGMICGADMARAIAEAIISANDEVCDAKRSHH
jgi:hypothetical protein